MSATPNALDPDDRSEHLRASPPLLPWPLDRVKASRKFLETMCRDTGRRFHWQWPYESVELPA